MANADRMKPGPPYCRVCRQAKPQYTKDSDRRLICLDCAIDGALDVFKQAIRAEVERVRSGLEEPPATDEHRGSVSGG